MLEIIIHFFYGDDCNGDEGSAYLCLFGNKRCENDVYVENLEDVDDGDDCFAYPQRSAWPDDDGDVDNDCDDQDCDDHEDSAYPVLCLARRGVKMVITAVAVIPQRKTRFPPYLHF